MSWAIPKINIRPHTPPPLKRKKKSQTSLSYFSPIDIFSANINIKKVPIDIYYCTEIKQKWAQNNMQGSGVLLIVEGHLWKAQWKEKPNDEGRKKLTM